LTGGRVDRLPVFLFSRDRYFSAGSAEQASAARC
jgi:hypothetical protein